MMVDAFLLETPDMLVAKSRGTGSFDCGRSLRLRRKDPSSLRVTNLPLIDDLAEAGARGRERAAGF